VQTLSEAERRVVAAWAADCVEQVLGLFEADAPRDSRPRDSLARTRAFARGEPGVAGEIRLRFVGGRAAREVSTAAAAAAARAAGQAADVPHMGAQGPGCCRIRRPGCRACRFGPPRGCRCGDPMAAQQSVGGSQRCSPAASASRRGPLRSAWAWASLIGYARRDHPRPPGRPDRRRALTLVDGSIVRSAGIVRLLDDESGHGALVGFVAEAVRRGQSARRAHWRLVCCRAEGRRAHR
jgi:Imm-5 like putative immunity protein